nr:substrate-binding domain-containing protein [Chromobacterium sp. ASV5]
MAFLRFCLALCAPAAALAAAPANLGITVGALDNPFYQALVRGAVQAARGINPDVQITSLSANFTLSLQAQQMQQLIEQKVDLILLGAVDSQAIAPWVRQAQQAGIKVVAVDVDAPAVDGTVKSDNLQAGEVACRYLADQLRGRGSLVIQSGPPVSSVADRIAGCRKALAAYPRLRVLSDDGDGQGSSWGGRKLTMEQLQRYPKLDAIFTINDRQALGAEQAAHSLRRPNVLIASVDGSPDIERALRRPGSIVASACQQPAAIGAEAVKLGARLLRGEAPASRVVIVPVQLVTRKNLTGYQGWLGNPPPANPAGKPR